MDGYIGKKVFENWKVDSVIGEGSFGKVYKIKRTDFGRTYWAALKIVEFPAESELKRVRNEGRSEAEAREYFLAHAEKYIEEVELMYQLKGDTNIVSFDDHKMTESKGKIKFTIMVKMELLTPIGDWLKDRELRREDVIRLGLDMSRALESCNKLKIIHRDIKPENIFVSSQGHFKLGDFGAARTLERTTSGLSKTGTPFYMAPEIHNNQPYGPTVDTYSLGLVLYRLLNNNRLPFCPDPPKPILFTDEEEAIRRRVSGEKLPRPMHAHDRLGQVILKATAFNVNDRYHNPTELRKELERCLKMRDISAVVWGGTAGTKPIAKLDKTLEDDDVNAKSMNEATVSAGNEDRPDFSQTIRAEVDAEEAAAKVSEQTKIDIDEDTGEKAKRRKRLALIISGAILALLIFIFSMVIFRTKEVFAEFTTETATFEVDTEDDLALEESSVVREELIWESSDERIATVDASGRIKTLAAGQVEIRIRYKEKVLDKLQVEVVEEMIGITQVNLNQSEVRLKVGEQFRIETEILPANASNKELAFRSGNTAIAKVDGPTITGVNPGEVKITVVDFKEAVWAEVKVIVEAVDGGASQSNSSQGQNKPPSNSSGGQSSARPKIKQYRYRDKQTKTSSSSSEAGWNYQSEAWGAYGAWSSWSKTNPGAKTDERNVESKWVAEVGHNKHQWQYKRYLANGTVYNYDAGGGYWDYTPWLDYALADKGPCLFGGCRRYGSYGTSNKDWWFPSGERDTWVVDSAAHTEYRYQTRAKIYTLWKWGDWSGWSTTAVTASVNREVETREIEQ